MVYLQYCDGSMHSGARVSATNDTFGLYFSGHHTIAAVLEQLQAQQVSVPIEAWVTFTCRDGGAGDGICDHGDLFEDCVRAVAGCRAIVGCGFNCT